MNTLFHRIAAAVLILLLLTAAGCLSGEPGGDGGAADRRARPGGAGDDGSGPWVQTGGPSGGYINDLAMDPGNPDRLYAAGSPLGLYLSEDRGRSWTLLPFVERQPVQEIEIDPHNPSVLYSTFRNFARSDDGGHSWHEANFGMVSFDVEDPLRQGYYALAISESEPQVLYLGLYGKGVYRSVNGASTWYPANGAAGEMAGKRITALLVDRRSADTVYLAAEDGVYRTRDGGRSWQGLQPFGQWGVIWPIWDDRPLYQYTSLLIHPRDSRRVMIGTFPQGIYLSEDDGGSWRESNLGWTMDGVFRLVHHPRDPETVFAGTYNGLNRSSDFGGHWRLADQGWPEEQWVFSIDFDPSNPEIMYACSKNGENEGRGREGNHGIVMKSSDGGERCFPIMSGLDPDQEFYEILVDRHDTRVLYLAAQHEGIMLSTDAGRSWRSWNQGLFNTKPGSNGNNVTRFLVLSADGRMLYFGNSGSGVFRRERYR